MFTLLSEAETKSISNHFEIFDHFISIGREFLQSSFSDQIKFQIQIFILANLYFRVHLHWENYVSISFHIEHWMGYDRGVSFPFNFESNEIPFVSKSKGKLSPRSYPIQYERKWKHSFLSVKDNCIPISSYYQ